MFGVTDEDLMAWVDGELPDAKAAHVAAAVAADATLAARAARLRTLNQHVRRAFAKELDEPVPQALAAIARGEHLTAPTGSATIHPLASRRRRLGWPAWGGIAASVLLTLAVAPRLASWSGGPMDSVQTQADGRLVAHGPLAAALDQGLASEPRPDGTRLLLSFRDRNGQFCRSFAAPVGRGLACRDHGQWQVVVLTAPAAPAPGTPVRLASGDIPAVVLGAVEQRIAGLALDADQERSARDAGWAP